MQLYLNSLETAHDLAVIIDLPKHTAPAGIATAGLEKMRFIGESHGRTAFWVLLDQALAEPTVTAVAVSLNAKCVFDDELPTRLTKACACAAGEAKWSVLAGTGKWTSGTAVSVVYPSATPRLFTHTIPLPIIDCGLDLFVINAEFLRKSKTHWQALSMPVDSFPQYCILMGYIEGRVSVFRPELAIGIDGAEKGRDLVKHKAMLSDLFGNRLADETIPSLMGDIPLAPTPFTVGERQNQTPREKALSRPLTMLSDLVRRAVAPVVMPMSLSIVTRTRFSRAHLLRRLLSTLTRARHDLQIGLEVVLTTDIDPNKAEHVHAELQQEFPELELVLCINEGRYPHSRVDNLLGGIFAAKRDYVAIVDDDDFVDLDALKAISSARFLGEEPLLLMSSQVRNEAWRETGSKRWILESSIPEKTYFSDHLQHLFKGANQLPICSILAPRDWIQSRLQGIELRHDLSEDYAIYLALLCSPDLPPLLSYPDIFCMISSRNDGSNTITMVDRRPWVRDITLFLHDLLIDSPIAGVGTMQILGQSAQVSADAAVTYLETTSVAESSRQKREIGLLRAEVAHLRDLLAEK